MADLRIVDAPEIPTNSITGQEKLPTGGSGNYSITLDSVADYTKTKKDLADNTSVDGKVNGVRQELNTHTQDLLNPHQVTKGQIGLGNVDNTADADKPVSNSTQAAIISAVTPKADKNYVDSQLALKANKVDVYTKSETYTKQESIDLVNSSVSTALTPVNSSLDLAKRGIANRYDSSLTYNMGERVVLTNGDIVKSTVDGNANDPNVNMTGWDYAGLIENRTYGDVLGSPVKFKLNPIKASFLYGISDPLHLDDNLNNFRGLNNPDAYHDSNVAIGAVSFGRNNPPFAYLSLAGGHDCVPYGVASFVLGAGSCTGNPDAPSDGANYGYCSLAVGKDTQARGRISNAMGHLNLSESRYSSTDGYSCIAGGTQSSHPNYNLYGDEGAEGAAARAHGFVSKAYGNFAFAYGSMLAAYNGSQVIGKGINEGSPLVVSKRGLGLGYNVDAPTIFCQAGAGVNGAQAQIGFNTEQPISKYDFRFKNSEVTSYVIDNLGFGAASFDVVGLLNDGSYGSLYKVVTTHPNAGQAFGTTNFYQNNSHFLNINESGDMTVKRLLKLDNYLTIGGNKVLGSQMEGIDDLLATATLAEVIAKVNKILSVLRETTGHGLIDG